MTDDTGPRTTRSVGEVALGIVQVAVGFFGALVVLIYPIGFITLWLQMMRAYGFNRDNALYATSLVPTSDVAAQIISILPNSYVALFVMIFIGYFRSWMTAQGQGRWLKFKRWLGRGILTVLYAGSTILVGYFGLGRNVLTQVEMWLCLVTIFAIFLGGIGGGTLFQRAIAVPERSGRYMRYLGGAALGYLGALIAGVCLTAFVYSPALPTVSVDKKQSQKQVVATLLSHSDGFWHLVNYASDTWSLIAIPNERVFKVTIAEQTTAEQTTAEQTTAEQTTSEKPD
jgi:hypothetical protein